MARIALLSAVVLGLYIPAARAEGPPRHLVEAQNLVKRLDLKYTHYEHGQPNVKWSDPVEVHADCSGFLDALFMHSYGYDRDAFKRWFGSGRPSAARYHDAIADHVGFNQVEHVKEILPGDILAVKYFNRKDNTGHVMLAAGRAKPIKASKPIVEGTEQWEVKVIDSSKSGHGPSDTRHKKGEDGKDHDGLGEGVLRLYANNKGKVAGFSWSATPASHFMDPKDEHLVIGRLKEQFKP